MKIEEMKTKQLKEYIHKLQYQRDFIGCNQNDIDQLNFARTELVKRWERNKG